LAAGDNRSRYAAPHFQIPLRRCSRRLLSLACRSPARQLSSTPFAHHCAAAQPLVIYQIASSKSIHLRLCPDVSDILQKPLIDKAGNLTPDAQKLHSEGQQTINKNTGKPYFQNLQDLLDWPKQ
jgi:hypothetical protein